MKIPDKLYDILKWVVIIVLPAIATLYAALSAVWAWPYSEEIVTTIEEKNDISIDLLSKMIVNSIKLSEYYNSYIFHLAGSLL